MKRLVIAVIVGALGWSGYWLWQAQATRTTFEGWLQDRRNAGWQADYADFRVRGFPNRVDAVFTDLVLADPDSGLVWEAPQFQILQLSYKRGHEILVFPETQRLTLPSGIYDITAQGLRASVIHDGAGDILRANAEAEVLNIAGPGPDLAMAGLRAAMGEVESSAHTYRIGVSASALAATRDALDLAPDSADGLRLEARVRFDRDWTLAAADGPRPQPQQVGVKLAQYRTGGLEMKLAGELDVDAQGRVDGELVLKAVNWRQIVGQARDAGRLGDGMARSLEQGLGIVAGLSGNRETLDLPLDFSRGRVSMGPVPLGEAPRLRLP